MFLAIGLFFTGIICGILLEKFILKSPLNKQNRKVAAILFIHFVNILYFILRMKLEGSLIGIDHSAHSLQVWAHVFITE